MHHFDFYPNWRTKFRLRVDGVIIEPLVIKTLCFECNNSGASVSKVKAAMNHEDEKRRPEEQITEGINRVRQSATKTQDNDMSVSL